jgi:SOS-response transcriptional repressor LexA
MNGDRIADGDLVIVDPGRAPQHGDIGVFMIKNRRGGPVTVLKRLDLSQGTRLLPSSPAHAPIIIDNDQDVVTIGTVIASVHPMADQPAPPQQVSLTVTCPRSPGWAGSRRRAGGGGDPES